MICSAAQHTRPDSLPSPCITNMVLIPLATWLYLAALALLSIQIQVSRGDQKEPTPEEPAKSTLGRKILSVAYYLLLLALLGMFALELARLIASEQGIGLLPFSLAGGVLVGTGSWVAGRRRRWAGHGRWGRLRWTGLVWWVVLVVVYAVGTGVVGVAMREDRSELEGAAGTGRYPLSDQVTDRVVIVAVGVIGGVLEVVRAW